jgi:hypothetical protein
MVDPCKPRHQNPTTYIDTFFFGGTTNDHLPDFGIWEWFLLLWAERDPPLALQKMSWKKSDDPMIKKNTSNFGK